MSALPKPRDFAPGVHAQTVIGDFVRDGAHLFGQPLDPRACADLLAGIRTTHGFGPALFLSEEEFDGERRDRGADPQPGRNILDGFEDRLGFVEQVPQITEAATAMLGPGYEVLERKVVCSLSACAIPDWLKTRLAAKPATSLDAWVRPQHRDMTYVHGIDFHQDLIDHGLRPADFVTLDVCLHPVGRSDAPLCLLEGSHVLGGSVFPHNLTRIGDADWLYVNKPWGEVVARRRVLTGGPGTAALWHACTLHGAEPGVSGHERISLRYRLARRHGGQAGLDAVNAGLNGPLSLGATRLDAASGRR
ncbi:MAG: phytanoyl-CoA dioxygenase family protein [Phenylobacterium sp.]